MFKVSNFNWLKVLIFILTALLFSRCSNTRYLQNGESLLRKNKINVATKEKFVKKFVNTTDFREQLELLYRQKPNKKLVLGYFLKFKLWVYNKSNQKKENGWNKWRKNKVGEPPVIYDSTLAEKTSKMMENYLFNQGYFYAQVSYATKIKHKRATVSFNIIPNYVYTIREIIFPQTNDELGTIIKENAKNTLLKRGAPLNLDQVQAERERIANDFKNNGYFNFNKEYISFQTDSSEPNRQLDIYMKINYPPGDNSQFKVYYLNHIFIYTNHNTEKNNEQITGDTVKNDGYTFIGPSLKYKPAILLDDIFLKEGDRYSMKNYQLTINRLAEVGIFKFVDIIFKPTESDSSRLDCFIYLTPSKKQEVILEAELSTGSEAYIGTAGKLTYRNKNLFHRSEIFAWNTNLGVESQLINNKILAKKDLLIRNVDASSQFNFYFPEFLGPSFAKRWFSQQFNIKTRVSTSYNFLQRVELYNLRSLNFLYGWDWREFIFKRHQFNLVSINFVSVDKETQKFLDKLATNSLLKNSFIDQIIIGSNYTFSWNNQLKKRNFYSFRGTADIAGNLLRVGSGIFANLDFPRFKSTYFDFSKTPYKIAAGIPFAQFAKADVELKHYNVFNKNSAFVSRLNFGIGTGYWNSTVMPYIKQFYVGGANSIRAWRVRELGPGSFQDTNKSDRGLFFDNTGDLKLEANAEYRFKIISIFKGAFFVDAGNVWTVRKNEERVGAAFTDSFYNEIAIGTGFGLRFDFTFFVLRLDFGFKVRNPYPISQEDISLPPRRWLSFNQSINDMTINLAIGYPF